MKLFRNAHGITSTTGAGFLFVFKAWNQAHRRLHNCFHNKEDRQKHKLVVDVISCTFLIIVSSLTFGTAHADIFKCESKEENITYQDSPCTKAFLQEKIVVQKIDPEVTKLALKRLDEELKVFNEGEAKRIESERLKKTNDQPKIQVIEIHNETYKVIDPYNNHRFNDYPYFPTNTPQYSRPRPLPVNGNQKRHFNPPGDLSRQSNMNPPVGR